jgi:multiple sugar transport system substrate-binding protein
MKQAMMGKRTAIAATSLLTSIALLAGCGAKQQVEEQEPKQAESPKPVTITVFNPSNYSDYLWENLWVEPIKKKYPHITLVNMKNEKGNSLAERVMANNVPDIIQGQGVKATFEYSELGLLEDLTPLIQKHKIDLNQVEPAFMNSLKKDPNDSAVYGLPVTQNNAALFYNKSLFDKFGVPYPKDGMTWDEIYELARKMTRTEAEVKYRGLDFHMESLFNNNQMSLPFIDNKTDKAIVQTDGWKTFFTSLKKFYDIEGNNPGALPNVFNPFLKDQTVAMFVVSNIFSPLIEASQAGLNWDLVTMPTYSTGAKTGIQPAVVGLFVSSKSQHKDEALQVIAHLMSSEVQTQRSKIGEPSVLKNADIKKTFGSEMPHSKGRSFASFVSSTPAPMSNSVTKYDAVAITEMVRKFKEFAFNGKDVNTALREAEENINKAIDAQKKK